MTNSSSHPVWIHITVAGGLVQRVFTDVPARVFIEDFDNGQEPPLALWRAEPLPSAELLRLLTRADVPHRIVSEEE